MKAVIFLIVAAAGFLIYRFALVSPVLQGTCVLENGQAVIAQRARPVICFEPDAKWNLEMMGWKTVRPEDSRLRSESVRVALAVYTEGDRQLVTALAEAPGEWEWEAGQHSPYHTLRNVDGPHGKQRVYKSIYLLEPKSDPFTQGGLVLVCRFKFLPFFRHMQVLVEYREPVDERTAQTLDLNPEYLRDFSQRAQESVTVHFPANANRLPELQKLETAGDGISRQKLSRWLGEIMHPGAGR